MFETKFKRIDDILRLEDGTSGAMDYVEQTSWILFLKYLDDLDKNKKITSNLGDKKHASIIKSEFQWRNWASPKLVSGKVDRNKALSGDDLSDFVNKKLFPYLRKFKAISDNPNTIEYKIGEIFSEIKNKIQNGQNLREIIDIIDELRFQSKDELHELSHLYEEKIKTLGGEGKSAGEYHTPRPLIKTLVRVVDPKIGETIYDGACGSAGFLVESYEYLKQNKLSTKDLKILQSKTFFGKEKKPLPYILGVMNMILHGIEAPNIIRTNTLTENVLDIQEKDRFNIVLANPPFGGKERKEVQQNFPIKTHETAFLFLQHFMKMLKAGGRAGIIIKNTFLSNTDNAAVSLRKELLENYNLYSILDLPNGAFKASSSAGVKTVVLFFEKGSATRKIWYYQLNLERSLGKTNPLNEKDLADFVALQKDSSVSDNSWITDIADVDNSSFDLSFKNPNKKDEDVLREPKEILEEIKELDDGNVVILESINKQIQLKN